jgi:hypothetical protein
MLGIREVSFDPVYAPTVHSKELAANPTVTTDPLRRSRFPPPHNGKLFIQTKASGPKLKPCCVTSKISTIQVG